MAGSGFARARPFAPFMAAFQLNWMPLAMARRNNVCVAHVCGLMDRCGSYCSNTREHALATYGSLPQPRCDVSGPVAVGSAIRGIAPSRGLSTTLYSVGLVGRPTVTTHHTMPKKTDSPPPAIATIANGATPRVTGLSSGLSSAFRPGVGGAGGMGASGGQRKPRLVDQLLGAMSSFVSVIGTGADGGEGKLGGEVGGDRTGRGPQSAQSVPQAQWEYCEPSPPSLHMLLEVKSNF